MKKIIDTKVECIAHHTKMMDRTRRIRTLANIKRTQEEAKAIEDRIQAQRVYTLKRAGFEAAIKLGWITKENTMEEVNVYFP